ncbi:MAG TPA: metal ABC transporter permease [Thermoanaerobaculia bacterium]|nr:metal ABC transporter permease [Thermoanaerobaculia bacterium]
MQPTLVILLVAGCVAASCALVGTFLVLRQMSLLGDAISHSVLPGIVIAFLLTGDRSPLPMLLGAGALGVVTVLLVELFNRTKRLKEDASIGVVFPALFSLGVILIARYASQVDLDLDCVLYGEIAYAPLDVLFVGDRVIGPKALWVNGGVLLLVALFVALLYKELKLSTFDPALAGALGFSPLLLHYLLMSAVSITVVGAFESVGAILVVAMLVVPAAAAHLLTDRLGLMLTIAVGLGVTSALLGYALARALDASIAGSMATATGALFALAFLLSPRYGMLARGLRNRRVGRAMREQLLLLHLRRGGDGLAVPQLAQRFGWSRQGLEGVVGRLRSRGWIESVGGGIRLTPSGAATIEASGQSPLRHRDP